MPNDEAAAVAQRPAERIAANARLMTTADVGEGMTAFAGGRAP
ncbi:hypothetical protein V1227_00570 [Lentzea sp. DG1S-22]|nr:hypothetical protein [Lentzea sp. DG1S-22]WVH81279.1 hypothetical protein V1227_00570 [Lentzea sp. DG1S-22]